MQKGELASVSISPELNTNTQLVEDDDFFYQHWSMLLSENKCIWNYISINLIKYSIELNEYIV